MSLQVQELTADYTGLIVEADYQEYIRYDGTDQSTIMPMLVESAIRQAEGYCNASFGNKTFVTQISNFECGKNYYLSFAPIQTVTEVKVIAQDGTETVLVENTNYIVRGLNRKYIQILTVSLSYSNSILQINYSAGEAVPANINPQVKEGILQMLSDDFENRQEGINDSVIKVSRNSMVKLAPFRNNIF